MDLTTDTPNHFRVRAPWPEHFDLNLEVNVSNKCPYWEEKPMETKKKARPRSRRQCSDRLCRGQVCHWIVPVSGPPLWRTLCPLSWMMGVCLLSQSLTLLWLTSLLVCIWIL